MGDQSHNIPDNGVMGKRIKIGRVAGRAMTATLPDGTKVGRRQDELILIRWGQETDDKGNPVFKNFRTAPYDNHFIYVIPDKSVHAKGQLMMCTCGSPAVISGYNAYKHDASPSAHDKDAGLRLGEMAVCWWYTDSSLRGEGRHADGAR